MYNNIIFLFVISIFCYACQNEPIQPDVDAHSVSQVVYVEYPEDFGYSDAGVDTQTSQNDKCDSNQLHVVGEYCPSVEQKCLEWLDSDKSAAANGGIGPMRCKRFAKTKCLSEKKIEMDFCIDKYEWPNVKDQFPIVTITYEDAIKECESVGKRLCSDQEWTLACEGPSSKPYPYGYERDEQICNTKYNPMPVGTPKKMWKDYYRAEKSGSNEGCVSDYGVYDMVGNVDELVHNTSNKPFKSGLKGGYWTSKVRVRCRPMTVAHNEYYSYYQEGFRCCSGK